MSMTKTSYHDWTDGNRARLQSATGSRSMSYTARGNHLQTTRATSALLQKTARKVEHAIGSRVDEINQMLENLERTSAEVFDETNMLEQAKDKIEKSLQNKSLPLEISKQCQKWREGRMGVDLVDDEVDKALDEEVKLLQQIQTTYQQILEDTKTQLRNLRAAKYKLDQDIRDKREAESIDHSVRSLKATSAGLDRCHDESKALPTGVDPDEWHKFSADNLNDASYELESSRSLRSSIDNCICDCEADLRAQWAVVDGSFNDRLAEATEAHHRLKDSLAETQTEIDSQDRSIRDIEYAINEKEAPLLLAETRLRKRAVRPNVELVRDRVHSALVAETKDIEEAITQLKHDKEDAEEVHRSLVRAENELNEDIHTKINSINIDNQCMQRRQHYKYRQVTN